MSTGEHTAVSLQLKTIGVKAVEELAKKHGLTRIEVYRRMFKAGYPIVEEELNGVRVSG